MNPLQQYLKKKGLSACAFARRTGLNRITVYRIATGRRGVGLHMMTELERATKGGVPARAWLRRAS
jgi:transcriptional regulator with XRE-family HTH domain